MQTNLEQYQQLEVDDDFEFIQLSKKQKEEEKDENKQKECKDENCQNSQQDQDTTSCPICFENWTSVGDHRIVSLDCGHLFGKVCIERWLFNRRKKGEKGKCPQCNKEFTHKEIRTIFTKRIVTLSCEQCDKLREELEQERKIITKLRESETKLTLNYQMNCCELARLKRENEQLQKSLEQLSRVNTNRLFKHEKTVSICSKDEAASCFDLDQFKGRLLVGKGNRNCPNSYGILKMNIQTGSFDFFSLRSSLIRQVKCSPFGDDLILSCSDDKALQLSSAACNATILTYDSLKLPVWSCAFNPIDRNLIYAGLSNGSLVGFDLRNTKDSLFEHSAIGTLKCSMERPLNSISFIDDSLIASSYSDLFTFPFDQVEKIITNCIPIEDRFICSGLSVEYKNGIVVANIRNQRLNVMEYLIYNKNLQLLTKFSPGIPTGGQSKSSFLTNESTNLFEFVIAESAGARIMQLERDELGCNLRHLQSIKGPEGLIDFRHVQNSDSNLIAGLKAHHLSFFAT